MSGSAKGFKAHLEKNIRNILAKVDDDADKWGNEFKVHTGNTVTHSKLCKQKNGTIYAPMPIKRAYLNEIWLSELPPPAGVDTQSLLAFVIDRDIEKFKSELHNMAPSLSDEDLLFWYKVMSNLFDAVNELFDADYDEQPLSEDLIRSIHVKLTTDILEQSGEYRTVEVGAAGSSVKYETPSNIQPRLLVLIDVINKAINDAGCFERAVAVGGFFFSEFLLIHPFRDGNGRTARLLLSHLLRHWTVVPISLYLRSNRKYYINALLSRTGTTLPLQVLTYVAQCVEETVILHYRERLDAPDDGSVPILDIADNDGKYSVPNNRNLLLCAGGLLLIGLLQQQRI